MSPRAGEREPRVVLYGRSGCHLCDEARATIEAVCAELGEAFVEVDIDHAEVPARFSEEVPVTFVDGKQHDYWRVDAVRLRKALTSRR